MQRNIDEIVYTKVGSGPHLCFLHGFCEDGTIWDQLAENLSTSYTILVIDLPGFGQSSGQHFETLEDHVEAVRLVLEFERATHCTLLGHSMGGYIAAAYAKKYPVELQALAFVHSTTMADSGSKKESRDKAINHIKLYGTTEYFKHFVTSLVTETHLKRLHNVLTTMVEQTKVSSILNGLHAMRNRPSYEDVLRNLHKPVLFIRGEEDKHYTEREITQQVALCSVAQYSVLKGVAHLGMFEDIDQMRKEIYTFLDLVHSFYS